jgi:hypothetical protein
MVDLPASTPKKNPRRAKAAIQARLQMALILNSSKGQQGSVLVGLFVALGLVVSAAGAVWLLQGGKLASQLGSDANNAQAVAEAGADQVIGVWNQPENRRLLVSGDAAPSTWTATNQTSPCLSSTNTRPGANNGNPSAEARNLVDGNFRNIDNIGQTATGDRQFRLRAIRYSTGTPGSADRRTISRTFNVANATSTSAGIIPNGSTFRDLINLDDPDGVGALKAGVNTGYIAVEVESRVFRNGVQVATATVTKEFQVLPKCCGASFGSNNTGGQSFTGSGSLGSDSRLCGVDFGMIVGLNGGKFWTYFNNDIYRTIDPSTASEVNMSTILGLVTNPSHRFERNAASADSNNGCRVIPGPCSTVNDLYVTGATTGSNNDLDLFNRINTTNAANTGTASDKAGNSASGIPIIPLFINGGLPSVNSRFGYAWTSGGRPATNFASGGTFGPTFTSTAPTTTFRLRTRNDTTPPRVEFCDGTYPTLSATSTNCTSTSPRNSWAQISLPQGTASATLEIADNFASNTFTGITSGSVNRWPDIWTENDGASGGAGVASGNVTVASGVATLRFLSGAPAWGTATNRAAIARVVNLVALQSPSLQFVQTVTNLSGSSSVLNIQYSTTNAAINTDTGWTNLANIDASFLVTPTAPATGACTGSGVSRTCRITLPPAAQTGYTKLRFRANSSFTTAQNVSIDNVAITNSTGGAVSIDNWCEYSSTFPATDQFTGGFHCLGPLLGMALGGRFIVDTSGGNLSFHYNSAFDTRGQSLASPLINMAAGAELLHVNCPTSGTLAEPPRPAGPAVTPRDNCLTGVPSSVYAAVGENDLLNIFGRDTSPSGTNMQWVRIGSTTTSPGKISGAFIYMPWGSVYLIADGCDGGGTVPTTFNFSGRVWSRTLIACGRNYFLTPPSSTLNLAALGINSNVNLNTTNFVGWTGTDWQASTSTSTLINSSL